MKWLLLSVVIVSTVLGDVLQSREMKLAAGHQPSPPRAHHVLRLIAARRYLLLAVASMGVSFFAFLALVQTEPISFAVPASAGSFVVETLMARLFLREHLSRRRTVGALMVCGGILLVAR